MQVISRFIQDADGNIVPSAAVFLYAAGTTDLVGGLTDIAGNPLANPMSTDENGQVQFVAPTGNYDFRAEKGALSFTTRIQVLDLDAAISAAQQASASSASASESAVIALERSDAAQASAQVAIESAEYTASVAAAAKSTGLKKFPRTRKTGDQTFFTSVAGSNFNLASFRVLPRGRNLYNPGLLLVAGHSIVDGLSRDISTEETVRALPRGPAGYSGAVLVVGDSVIEQPVTKEPYGFDSPVNIPRGYRKFDGVLIVMGDSVITDFSRDSEKDVTASTVLPRGPKGFGGVLMIMGDSVITDFSRDGGTVPTPEPEPELSVPERATYPQYRPNSRRILKVMNTGTEDHVFAVEAGTEVQITPDGYSWPAAAETPSGILRCVRDDGTSVEAVSLTPAGQMLRESAVLYHKYVTGQSLSIGSRGFVLDESADHEIENGRHGYVFTQDQTGDLAEYCLTLEGGPRPASPEGSTTFIPMREGPHPTSSILGETIVSGWGFKFRGWADQETGFNPRVLGSISGFGGAAYALLKKGSTVYTNGMRNVTNVKTLCDAEGWQHFVGSVSIVHGENQKATTDAEYAAILREWVSDYQVDIPAVTGQAVPPVGLFSQTNTGEDGTIPAIPQGQLICHKAHGDLYLTGPKYQYPYFDRYHMLAEGYVKTGELDCRVERLALMGYGWDPLMPLSITASGNTITLQMNNTPSGHDRTPGPVGRLVIDTDTISDPGDYGFTLESGTITGIEVDYTGTKIIITAAENIAAGDYISYAMQVAGFTQPSNGARGNIRDQDYRDVSRYDGKPVYNWLVAFRDQITLN